MKNLSSLPKPFKISKIVGSILLIGISIRLIINESRLKQLLENQGCDVLKTVHNSMVENEENLQTPLVMNKDESEVDVNLLKDALLAYVFYRHHVDFLAENVQVNMKYKVEGNFISRFLKFNLKDSQKYKVGYGLEHTIKNDILRFSGFMDKKFNQKTLVIQITSIKQKILKGVWVYGRESRGQRKDEAKGKISEKGVKNNDSYVL